MSKSERPTFDELRRVFRLVGEVRELGVHPDAWKRHMASELATALGSGITGSAEIRASVPFELARLEFTRGVNFASDRQERDYLHRMATGEYIAGDPALPLIARMYRSDFTRVRRELIPDRAWRASRHANEQCRPFDIDTYITSHRFVPTLDAILVIVVTRGWRERPLGMREAAIVRLLHDELARVLHRSTGGEAGRRPLAPSLARTLARLCDGESEKEAAYHLGLSPATVHGYVKQLHRRFGVRSRGELISRAFGREGLAEATQFRPRLHLTTMSSPTAERPQLVAPENQNGEASG